MAEYQGMTPSIVVGLGGTGKEVIIKIRRMIVETYGSLDALPIVSFLHVDTEQNAKVSEPQVVLKQDISLRPVEQVWAKVDNAKAILNRIADYDYLTEWFPPELTGTDSILAGAGQIRALGKFAFTVNYQTIKNAFANARARIVGHEKFMLDRWGVQLDKGVNIFIVCSLSGGTGSGMVLDMAYNVRDWVPPSDLPQTCAFLVLPGAFSGLGDRVIANAYAALMELDHYSRPNTRFETQYSNNIADRISSQNAQDTPFSFCYLVGNSNDKVTLPSLEAVLEMVAQNIFLDFSSGFSQYKKLVRDNIRKHWSSPDPLGFPQNYITFGLASIQFPVQRVLNACASRLAVALVDWWANPTPAPTAMRDVIKTEILPSLGLAESEHNHQLLDNLSVGDNMKPYSKEVSDWVASLRKRRNDLNIPFENLQRFISVEEEKYRVHFNDADSDPRRWSDYFQKMWDNLNRLIPQKTRELRETVAQMVEDRFRGPKWARQFLEVLMEVWLEFRTTFDQSRQKEWLARERSASQALQILLKQIDNHARQMLLVNKKKVIDDDFNAIMQALESIYVSKVEVKARALAIPLLDALREETQRLLNDLNNFDKNLENLRRQLAEREEVYTRETGTLTVNGILLYDPKDIEQIYQKTLANRGDSVFQSMTQDIWGGMGGRLFDLHTFEHLRQQDLYQRIINRAIDEFSNSEQLKVSVAEKFIAQYPTVEQQEAQLKSTFEKSEAFLRFSQEQARLGWDDRPEKRQTLVGIQGGNKPTDPAVAALLPLLRKATTLTDKDIRPYNDPHHIYFVREIGAFPLRLIEGMERMRTIYRTVSQMDRNPLHTHHNRRLFADIMPPSGEEIQVRENLVLGRVFQLLTESENKITGYTEIKLNYRDSATGLARSLNLGSTWEEAEQYLLADQNRRARELLNDEIQKILKQATTKDAKRALYEQLMSYLQTVEQTVPGGRDNPEYQRTEEVISNCVRKYGLFEPGMTANSTPTPAATPTVSKSASTPQLVAEPAAGGVDSALEKFTKLVEACFKGGKTPSEKELEILDKLREKYGVSKEKAAEIIARYQPKQNDPELAAYEYALMFRAFLENDGEIGLEERAQLLELQEELRLTDEQVATIEANIRDELGLT
ncbi:MAG: tubulin-like doman-containing protein [Gloeomargarita sp. SKYG116]|nr:tubulin-like doman-containing protein [Gloeomargarita sp. SKYG116]MDW8400143.1 tubulin-like doman-containing protein [Gloeomargarita sp. SKYGB_i_bin116]